MVRRRKCNRQVFSGVLIVLFLSAITPVASQESKAIKDLQLWSGIKVEKTFAKDWTISLEQELRLRHNVSEISNYFTELGLRYKINRNFALEGDLRFTRDKKRDNSYVNYMRYNFDLRYKGRLDFLTIYYRMRYQKEAEGMEVFEINAPYVKQFRNRIKLGVTSLKQIEPYVSAEIFQIFTPLYSSQFEYYRIVAGIRYEPGKIGEFDFGWGFNREISSPEPAMIFMFKINYTYKF
jgi:hypothetical protein